MAYYYICSPKGGIGKSTFCYQYVAPYSYIKTQKKPLILDCDNANREFETFSKSSILESRECNLSDINNTNIFFEDRDLIFDTGSTTLCQKALNNFYEIGAIDNIDHFFIPLTTGTQSFSSAIDVYNAIKGYKADAKICFILNSQYDINELPLEIQFIDFLGDQKYFLTSNNSIGRFDELKKEDPNVNYLVINFVACLFWTNSLNLTAFEYADKVNFINTKVSDALKKAKQDPSLIPHYRLASNRLRLAKQCQKFRNELEQNFFKKLDEVLNV